MRAMVAKTAVVAAATGGLAASFLLPLAPQRAPATPEEALRMPVATRETTVSVFPAPGRPESSPAPLERSQRPATPRRRGPTHRPASPVPPRIVSPLVSRSPAPPIRPQTDERLLAELGPQRPDDRSPRPLVAE
jgi:hypothetical protein